MIILGALTGSRLTDFLWFFSSMLVMMVVVAIISGIQEWRKYQD